MEILKYEPKINISSALSTCNILVKKNLQRFEKNEYITTVYVQTDDPD